MIPHFGALELVIILVIVAMLFGVGKLPEVFGAVGKGVREFRTNAQGEAEETSDEATAAVSAETSNAQPEVKVSESEPVKTTETNPTA